MKILIAINNLTMMDQLAYANHCQFWYRLGKNCSEHEFALCNPRRLSIDRMRNFSGKAAIEHNFDYLMFIDDDVLLPMDAFTRLLKADKDIIAGVTLIRGYPYHPMIFNFVGQLLDKELKHHFIDNYVERADENGLLECDAVGFSCCLIKVDILRKMNPPYFITGENHTEDVYFCFRAKNEVKAKVWVDTRVLTAHILGSEIVEPDNLSARIIYDELIDPTLREKHEKEQSRQKLIDPKILRKVDYAEMVKEQVFG